MPWYRTGTVSVTNGSTTVTGSGTNWIDGAAVGEAFIGPDAKVYEIAAVVSATQITLATAYQGTTQTGQLYQIVPLQSYIRDLAAQAATLVSNYGTAMTSAGQGAFGDGTVSAPGVRFTADGDTGLRRVGTNSVAVVAGGADRLTVDTAGVSVTGNLSVSGTLTANNSTLNGKLTTAASAAGGAGISLPHGVAPTTPVNGDVWTTTSGLFARVNGATKTVAFTDSSITGNAATATKLQTPSTITIGNTGKSFDGSANVSWSLDEIGVTAFGLGGAAAPVPGNNIDSNTIPTGFYYVNSTTSGTKPYGDDGFGHLIVSREGGGTTARQLYLDNTTGRIWTRVWVPSQWSGWGEIAFLYSTVATATKLQTPRTITIGNTGKSFDGSANVSWSLDEIGAAIVSDIGTAPNQVPLNGYLGTMAYQDRDSVSIGGGVVTAQIRRRAPVTKTDNFTVDDTEHWLICNGAGTITVTLPNAGDCVGREIMIKTIAAQSVVSASSNVVPLGGGAAGTAILPAAAGKFATLVSDGTNWVIMQAN